jgi:xyloglucan-specific exo-beta-1,4-glucanase
MMKKGKFKTFFSVIAAIGLLSTLPVGIPLNTNAANDVATESYTWQNAEIGGGGYVVNVIFNNTEEDLIYARTDMGGAYRYNPATERWVPLTDMIGFDDWNNLGCDSLATDPVDTNRVYIAAGTYTNNWTNANGCILRSTDKGNTWEKTELPFKLGANMMGRSMGERLAIDPNSNNVLYMGTRSGNGLWKSTDYGVTWSKVSTFTEVGNFIPTDDDPSSYDNTLTGVVWVTFDPASSESGSPCQTIYVGVANKAKSGEAAANTVFCSKDGGSTWNAVEGQPKAGYFPHHGVLSSDGILYVTYSNGVGPYNGTKGDVWKYNTKTGDWTQISPIPSSNDNDNYFGYGGIAVDAQNPDTLVVTTLNSWWPDANIFRSTDGGSTWTRFWEWNGYPSRTLRYTQDISAAPWLTFGKYENPPEPEVKIGWMMGNISIDPFNSDRMLYSTGATIYGTDNLTDIDSGGKVNLTVKTLGIEQTAVLSLISPTTGTAHLVSGLGDVTGFVHEDLTKVPDMMMIRPSFSSTTGMDYAELVPNKYVRVGNTDAGTNPRIGISYDSSKNWFAGSNCWSASSSDNTEGGKVAMSADGDTILWAPSGKTPSYSTNDASSWTTCKGLPVNAQIASDRVNPKKFYGFSGGTFYVSTDGGATFTAAAKGLPNTSSVNFKAIPGIEGDIWFAGGYEGFDYGLYHSTDSGATFTRLSNVEEADVVGFGMAAPGKDYMALYISAQIDGVRGFFRSDDVGESWVRINDDQHQYGVTNSCITGDPRIYGRVYVGTNGRGIVYGDIGEGVTSATITPTTASFDKNADKQEDISVTMTLNDNTFTAIKNGSTKLKEGTDYAVSDNTVTIKKEYLAAQAVGTTNLTFLFSAGDAQMIKITIADSTPVNNSSISMTTASFDQNTDKQEDISVTMTLNGNTLTAIKNGTTALSEGTDYSISDNTVTIKKEYLAAQEVGTTNLTFDFSAGDDPVLAITIDDTTIVNHSSISPDTASFDKNKDNQADISVTMTLNGNTLTAIKNGTVALSEGTDYSVTDNIVTIKKAYLAAQSVGTTDLTFDFSAGKDAVLKVDIVNTTIIPEGSIKIQMYNRTTDASSVAISPQYKIINTGSEAIDLADVKIRYYFTVENSTDQSFWCDWSNVDSAYVTGKFVTMENPTETADCYLEIGFTSEAGSLASGKSAYVQTRFNKSNWSNYTQSNDYSFNSSAKDFADWTNVTAYISDSLQWGMEP